MSAYNKFLIAVEAGKKIKALDALEKLPAEQRAKAWEIFKAKFGGK